MAKRVLAGIVITVLAAPFLIGSYPPTSAAVPTPKNYWIEVPSPREGEDGGWVLAEGSDITSIALSSNGTLFAAAAGTGNRLYKSDDGGYTWTLLWSAEAEIIDIKTDPQDADTLYCATGHDIYRSDDAGASFRPLAANAILDETGKEITGIDIARYEGATLILCGVRDTGNGEYGGVYLLRDEAFAQWMDTRAGDFDIYAAGFAPDFDTSQQIIAVAGDETDTFVITKAGNGEWGKGGGTVRLTDESQGPLTIISADIAFPRGYRAELFSESCLFYIVVNSGVGEGDVYRISGGDDKLTADDLNVAGRYGRQSLDVSSIAVCGSGADAGLLCGAAASGQVYHSSDGGRSWWESRKPPAGAGGTQVIMSADYSATGRAFAATGGAKSAFSTTADGGQSWSQTGLIDARIDSIVGLAVSPGYEQDGTLFLLTWGDGFSLWRSTGAGTHWQRLLTSADGGIDCIDHIAISPHYGATHQVVFLAGASEGSPAIWKSADGGLSFTKQDAPIAIDAWAIADDDTLFIAGFNGDNGLVFYTSDFGQTFSAGTPAGNQSIRSIKLSPDYADDKTILIGNSNGLVFRSMDGGASFRAMPAVSTEGGNVSVGFGASGGNDTIYAALDSGGIFSFSSGHDASWNNLDVALDAEMFGGLEVSGRGVLYATSFRQVNADGTAGGLRRCLDPAGKNFEAASSGLEAGMTLWGLQATGDRLWSIDTTGNRIMTYVDGLAAPVRLISPENGAEQVGSAGKDTVRVSLDWEETGGATGYTLQVDDDPDFSSPANRTQNTSNSSMRISTLEPGTVYFWRVKARGPVSSPWSQVWSFTTAETGTGIDAPELLNPAPGASGVEPKPLFKWSKVSGATAYELIISGSAAFSGNIISKQTLEENTWQCNAELDFESVYYWKVRAIGRDSTGAWSDIGFFTTQQAPAPTTAATATSRPPPANTPTMTVSWTGTPPPQSQTTTSAPADIQTTATQPTTITTPSVIRQAPRDTMPDRSLYLIGLGGIAIALLSFGIGIISVRRRKINI